MSVSATGYFSHPDCSLHEMGPGHPECPERLSAIADGLLTSGLAAVLEHPEVPLASHADLALAHDSAYLDTLQNLAQRLALEPKAYARLDPDTVMNAHSWQAALRAAGAAVAATDAVLAGRLGNAFCAVRPPGHHACRAQAMGFCLLNNVAIAARHALVRHGLARVAVVDFDVHHGNGTEDILAHDPRVLMLGIFQHPFYPFSGADSTADNVLNLPLPAYTRGPEVRRLIEAHWLPRLQAFAPQMIFVSAGFDAHRDDDLGQLGLVEADYAWITERLLEVAQQHASGRLVSCLEGGYNLDALALSVQAHLRVLAGV